MTGIMTRCYDLGTKLRSRTSEWCDCATVRCWRSVQCAGSLGMRVAHVGTSTTEEDFYRCANWLHSSVHALRRKAPECRLRHGKRRARLDRPFLQGWCQVLILLTSGQLFGAVRGLWAIGPFILRSSTSRDLDSCASYAMHVGQV